MSTRLLKSTVTAGGMTLVSRVSGLARDVVLASLIGASAGVAADAFFVAFRIPNFFRRIFGEGALAQAFVPVFVDYKTRETAQETREFLARLSGSLMVVLAGLTLLGTVAAPAFVYALAPGFADEPGKFGLTVEMLRITFPYLLCISLVALAGGVLNSFGGFAIPAFTPVLLNLSLIGAAVLAAPHMAQPAMALAWGVCLGGALQLAFQLPFLHRAGMLAWPRLGFRHAGVMRVARLTLPAVFGSSVAQVNLLVNTLLASFLATGSVSWLFYADRLMEFPLGVFGIALATVILPSLSRRHSADAPEDFSGLIDWALRWVFLIAVPATVGLVVLAGPMLTALFQYGAFSAHDVHMAGMALTAFAIGLPAFILVKVLATGFFARQDTRTPALIAAWSVAVNVALSLALVVPLQHTGLAAAVSIAAYVNASLLFRRLARAGIYRPGAGWPAYLARIGAAGAIMAAVVLALSGPLEAWQAASVAGRIGRLAGVVGAGAAVYLAAILALGIRPGHMLLKTRTP